jgi:S1-C subfamily serine protease
MNTAIRKDAQGLGFAIPVETLWRIATQLFETGKCSIPIWASRWCSSAPI